MAVTYLRFNYSFIPERIGKTYYNFARLFNINFLMVFVKRYSNRIGT